LTIEISGGSDLGLDCIDWKRNDNDKHSLVDERDGLVVTFRDRSDNDEDDN
jgi:hypothetical protein